jgi:epsilon-lactone hydrolase
MTLLNRTLRAFTLCSSAVFVINSYAADSITVESRTLSLPAAASEQLQASISAVPGILFSSRGQTLETTEQWEAFVTASGAQAISPDGPAQVPGVLIERELIAGVNVYRVTPDEIAPEHSSHLFLHAHGGGYIQGGGDGSVGEAVSVALSSGIPALSVDYRMPPGSPFPAAIDDMVAVYKEVLKTQSADGIAIGGTSAGGGLSFATVLQLKALGLPLPGALYVGTPWADLTNTSDTLKTNAGIDRVLGNYFELLQPAALVYADGHDLKDPLLSPLYGDFNGFPSTILFSGTRDLLLSDTVRSHRKLRAAGVVADLHVFEGLSHAGYLIAAGSPESQAMLDELSQFLKTHLN